MTTSTAPAQTIQQRAAAATSQLRNMLGLDDLKLLSVALAEAASEEARQNPGFSARIQAIYHELKSAKSPRSSRSQTVKQEPVRLVPIGSGQERTIDPAAPLDPYFLNELYGPHQLRLALSRYSLTHLKEGLPSVEGRNPGTKPRSRASKDSVIDYIVEHVAGPGY